MGAIQSKEIDHGKKESDQEAQEIQEDAANENPQRILELGRRELIKPVLRFERRARLRY